MADNASSKAFDYAAKNVIDLARVEAGSVAKVKTFLSGLESDLVKILNDNKDIAPGKKAKLETILKAAGSAIDSTYQSIGKQHAGDMAGLAKAQSAAAGKMLNHAIGVDVFGAVLTESQLASVAGDTAVFGHSSGDWWASQSSQLRFKFAGQMKQGYALGEDVDALVRRVRGTKAGQFKDGIMQASRREAEALVRSSIQTISNEARLKSFAALGDTIKGIEWVSTLDTRTTVICRALDGLVWTIPDLKPVGHAKVFPGPTAHWNCFVEETPVESAGAIQASYRRRYSGTLVTIETHGGRRFTATPNHPILTRRGWVAVKDIQQGDELVAKRRSGSRTFGIVPHNDDVVTFAELHKATAKLPGMLAVEVPISRPDFHGDGTDDQIGEVSANRDLLSGLQSAGAKSVSKFVFQGSDLEMTFAPGNDHLPDRLFSSDQSADGGMRLIDGRLHAARPSGMKVFGSGAGNPCPFCPSGDCFNTDAELVGDFARGELIFDVEFDRVSVVLSREAVSVWVHNLETETSWYFADGIASHNCRSTQIPVLRSWAELSGKPIKALDGQTMEAKLKAKLAAKGMSADKIAMATANARASMDGQVSGSPDMEAWLKSKPDSFIKGVLGPTRAKMLAEGKITIADLTDQNNRPLTIAELQAAIDGGGFAVETEGVDFEPFDKSALKKFDDGSATAAQDAAKAKIAAVLADPKAAGNSILSANLAKIQAAEPSLTPAELLAKAEEATAAKIAANTKSSILSKAKKKMLAGEEPTAAQKALIDDLGDDEKAAFLESVADAKTAKQITEANAAATAKLTSWSADPIKQKAIDKALADGATADKPLELAAAADKALGDLVAGETAGNQLAAAKKAMKALTGMNAPTSASVQAWLKQQGKDPAEFLAEFQAVTKEKADQSAKSSVLSKAKKKLAVGESMTAAQQKLFDDLTPEEQAAFQEEVEAMKPLKYAGPVPLKNGNVNWNIKKSP